MRTGPLARASFGLLPRRRFSFRKRMVPSSGYRKPRIQAAPPWTCRWTSSAFLTIGSSSMRDASHSACYVGSIGSVWVNFSVNPDVFLSSRRNQREHDSSRNGPDTAVLSLLSDRRRRNTTKPCAQLAGWPFLRLVRRGWPFKCGIYNGCSGVCEGVTHLTFPPRPQSWTTGSLPL